MRVVVKLFLFALFCVGVWYVDQYIQVTVNTEQARLAVDQLKERGPSQATQWGLLIENVYWVRFALWMSVVFFFVVAFWSDFTGFFKTALKSEA